MAKALGLDLGARVAKAVLLEKTAKGFTVAAYAEDEVPTESGAGEQAGAWLGSLLSTVGWRGEPVAVTVSARETILRELTVPFTDAEQLGKVVSYEAENYLPFPLEEAVLDFLPIAREAASTRLLAFAVRKATLAALQRSLEEAGVDPYLISVEPAAMLEALAATGALPQEPTILVDLGAASTKVLYLENGQPAYVRVVRVGGGPPSAGRAGERAKEKGEETGALSPAVSSLLSPLGAGAQEAGAAGGGQADAGARYVERVSRELRRLLRALPEAARSAPMLALGGYAVAEVLDPLSTALERKVEAFRLPEAGLLEGEVPAGLERGGLVAVGAAAALLGPAAFPINLAKGEFRYRPKLEKWRRPLSFILMGWTALAAALAIGFQFRLGEVHELDGQLSAHEQTLWNALAPGEPPPTDLATWTLQEHTRLEALASGGSAGRRTSALETLRAILDAIPPSVKVTVRSVSITPERATVRMVTDSYATAITIESAVTQKTGLVASAKNLEKKGDEAQFELEAVPGAGTAHGE